MPARTLPFRELPFRALPLRAFPGLLLSLSLLAGCDQPSSGRLTGSTGEPALLELEPPLSLLQSRIIDTDLLELDVRVNGESIAVQRDADDRWQGSVRVTSGAYTRIIVDWRYLGLPVATASRDVAIATDARSAATSFPDSEFDTTADDDGDNRSNLAEFDAGSDPRNSSDPGGVLPARPLVLRFSLPQALEAAGDEVLDALSFDLTVNGNTIDTTREGNRWRTTTSVPEGTRPFIVATIYANARRSDRLARIAIGDRNVGFGRLLAVARNEYRTEFDDDFDGVDNISEILAVAEDSANADENPGSVDSEDPGQPGTVDDAGSSGTSDDDEAGTHDNDDPCDISPFETGCSVDSDGDGRPDSLEGEFNDRDRDGIPDYLESSIRDGDGDGASAEVDVNDGDPCAPDPKVPVCVQLSADSDGDGELDAEEGEGDEDGDGIPDLLESLRDDADDDGTVDQADPDDTDPCIPEATRIFCL